MRKFLRTCAALTVVCALAVNAQADFLSPEFTGNAYFSSGDTQAFVSAAVFENTTADEFVTTYGAAAANAVFGTPSGGLDEATYIYMFQVVAVSPTATIGSLQVQIPNFSAVKSIGYISDYVLTDNGTAIDGSNANANALGDTDTGTFAFQPTSNTAGIDASGGAANLFAPGILQNTAPMGTNVAFGLGNSDNLPNGSSLGLLGGQYSPILFFTSNTAPSLGMAYATTTGGLLTDSIGVTTTPTPVPAGLALVFTGLPGILGMFFWRRKQAVAA